MKYLTQTITLLLTLYVLVACSSVETGLMIEAEPTLLPTAAPPTDVPTSTPTSIPTDVPTPVPPTPTLTPEPDVCERQSEPVTIRWFVGLGAGTTEVQIEAQERIVEQFMEICPQIIVQLEIYDNAAAADMLSTQIAVGQAPDIIGPVGIAGRSQFTEHFLDLRTLDRYDDIDLSQFNPTVVEFYNHPTQGQIALPFMIFPSQIWYNVDLFETAGVPLPPKNYGDSYIDWDGNARPWNTDTLRDIAMRLTLDADGNNATSAQFDPINIVQYGFDMQWTDFRGMLSLFGADSFYKEGTWDVPEAWIEGAAWYHDAIHVDHFMPTADAATSEQLAYGNEFASGHLAMAGIHAWYFCCHYEVGSRFDFAPIPAAPDGSTTAKLHADMFHILDTTEHPEEALAFIEYLTFDVVDKLTNSYGGIPAILSAQDEWVERQAEQFGEDLNWQVMMDGQHYIDIPSHEEWLPNETVARDILSHYLLALRSGAELDINVEMQQLLRDLAAEN